MLNIEFYKQFPSLPAVGVEENHSKIQLFVIFVLLMESFSDARDTG